MRAWIAGLTLACACGAQADTIYRCKAANGKVSIQSAPCASGHASEAKTYHAPAYSEAAARRLRQLEAAQADARRKDASTGARQGRGWSGPTASQQRAAGCAQAKANRDLVLRNAGMSRNFDLLRALDESVHRACR
jgi:hypothetical protein